MIEKEGKDAPNLSSCKVVGNQKLLSASGYIRTLGEGGGHADMACV